MPLSPDQQRALAELMHELVGASVDQVDQLTGGASRETYRLSVSDNSGATHAYILQQEPGEPRLANGLADEAMLIKAASMAGVPTATVLVANAGTPQRDSLAQSFILSEAVPGETIARRILREPSFEKARLKLTSQLGRSLGLLHSQVDGSAIPWLAEVDQIEHYRSMIDEIGIVSPSLELGLAWLERTQTECLDQVVVHGDFRLGNLIVDENGLAAVIDWELAHLGDPMEDLGWLCIRAWRFGGDKPVAGLGERAELFAEYAGVVGRPVDPDAVHWWEVMGTLKWGVMCAIQAERHLKGQHRSVELVAIGPRLAEQEYDLIELIRPEVLTSPSMASTGTDSAVDPTGIGASAEQTDLSTGASEGGGRPTSVDLLAAVEEFLRSDLGEGSDPRLKFHARVAANALAISRRDLSLAENSRRHNRDELHALGFTSERSLADAIRSGEANTEGDDGIEVWRYCYNSVVRRLQINNPKWLR